jgi:hypothetical protein
LGLLGLLTLAASFCFSQQASQQPLIGAPYTDFSGGYVDYVAPSNLQPNQSPNLLNVKIDDPPGSLKPREGFVQCGITPSGLKPTLLYEYNYNSGGGVSRFIVSDSSTVWQTQDCITYTTVTTRLAGGPLPFVATVRDRVWLVNRSTHVITWNGSSESILDGRTNTPNPAPPRFNYIEFWNERVWGARTNTNPSGVYFSDLTDTNGNDLDPSTGTLAWPADNVIQVAQENGSPIYGIKVYRNALFVFKENGIWRIDFNGPFDITVSKTLSSAGTRYQTSIVEHDNLLYFLGVDGFYAFDGDRAVRVSDNFRNKFNDINQTAVNERQQTWDTTADFNAGTYSSSTANDVSGSVTISSVTAGVANFDAGGLISLSSNSFVCIPYTGYSMNDACGPFASGYPVLGPYTARVYGANAIDSGTMYIVKKVDGSTLAYTGDGTLATLSSGSGDFSTYTVTSSAYAGTTVFLHFTGGGSQLYTSTFTIGSRLTFQYLNTDRGLNYLDNIQTLLYFSSAVWTSQIVNLVEVSSFSTFEAESVTNGGSIAYQIRVGTDATSITQNAYSPITPGALISGTTATIYVQVKSTLTAVSSLDATPELQNITVNTVRGTVQLKPSTHSLLAATSISLPQPELRRRTTSYSSNPASPMESWTLYDWQVGPMTEFNDHFYAGASTHSAISRMNYGTNDNGKAISWFWESREDTYERPNIRKYLMEIALDFRKGTESALTAGYSRDGGYSYTSKSASAVGTGRGTARFLWLGRILWTIASRSVGQPWTVRPLCLESLAGPRPAILRE